MTNPLGTISPDPFGQVFGTGYSQFMRPDGTSGLFRVTGRHLDILAVHVEFEGRGYLRHFMDECMEDYDSIAVWHIMNPKLDEILKRWGFKPVDEVESINGETEFISGYKWTKQP